jgi:hypothetical protein
VRRLDTFVALSEARPDFERPPPNLRGLTSHKQKSTKLSLEVGYRGRHAEANHRPDYSAQGLIDATEHTDHCDSASEIGTRPRAYAPIKPRPTIITTMSSAARYRKPAAGTSPSAKNPVGEQEKAELKAAVKEQAAKTSSGLSLLDVLRILGGVLLLSSGLSYLVTSGSSMTWGYNPWWTRAREWKTVLVLLPCIPSIQACPY